MLTSGAADISTCVVGRAALLESALRHRRRRCGQRRDVAVEELGHEAERLLGRSPTPLAVTTPFDDLGLDGPQGAAQGYTESTLHVGVGSSAARCWNWRVEWALWSLRSSLLDVSRVATSGGSISKPVRDRESHQGRRDGGQHIFKESQPPRHDEALTPVSPRLWPTTFFPLGFSWAIVWEPGWERRNLIGVSRGRPHVVMAARRAATLHWPKARSVLVLLHLRRFWVLVGVSVPGASIVLSPISPHPSRELTTTSLNPTTHLSLKPQPPQQQQAQQASRTRSRPKKTRNVAAPNIGRGRLVAAWCAVICGHRQGRGPASSWRANAFWGSVVNLSSRRRRSPRRG